MKNIPKKKIKKCWKKFFSVVQKIGQKNWLCCTKKKHPVLVPAEIFRVTLLARKNQHYSETKSLSQTDGRQSQ